MDTISFGNDSFRSVTRLAAIAVGAALATVMTFWVMLSLIVMEIDPGKPALAESFAVPSVSLREEEQAPERTSPIKRQPATPPAAPGVGEISSTLHADLEQPVPVYPSMAETIGIRDIQVPIEAPVSDILPMVVIQPAYPLVAVRKQIEGYVVVQFSVRENGSVVNPTVVDSEPEDLFDQAALAAVSRSRFKPREIGGDQVLAENVQLRYAFSLTSDYQVPQRR